jgi:hypothetical protein
LIVLGHLTALTRENAILSVQLRQALADVEAGA